jgi:transcriptional regulator with XRE-family HTH domain
MKEVRLALRAARKTHGWTQSDLAGRLGVTRQRVSQVEKAPPTLAQEELVIKILLEADLRLNLVDGSQIPSTGKQPQL